MEKNKAQELVNLTREFVEKYNELAQNEKDCGLIIVQRADDGEHTQGVINVHGTHADVMLALKMLDKETQVVQHFNKIHALMALKDVAGGFFNEIIKGAAEKMTNEESGDTSPSDSDTDEQ